MTLRNLSKTLATLIATSFLFTACVTDGEGDLDFENETPADLGKSDHLSLELTPLNASVSQDVKTTGGLEIITSAERYEQRLGAKAPADVDFDREWVAFFGIGVRNTGGFGATITSIDSYPWFGGIVVNTESTSPGLDCFVTQAITWPHTLVKFDIPAERPTWYATRGADRAQDCFTPPSELQAQLAESRVAYDQAVSSSGENYTYQRFSSSFFQGRSWRTTIVVEDGVIVERHFKSSSHDGPIDNWSEIGDEVGSHTDSGHELKTLDELYGDCELVLARDPQVDRLSFSTTDNGLLGGCTYTPRGCFDDCTRGANIGSVEFQ